MSSNTNIGPSGNPEGRYSPTSLFEDIAERADSEPSWKSVIGEVWCSEKKEEVEQKMIEEKPIPDPEPVIVNLPKPPPHSASKFIGDGLEEHVRRLGISRTGGNMVRVRAEKSSKPVKVENKEPEEQLVVEDLDSYIPHFKFKGPLFASEYSGNKTDAVIRLGTKKPNYNFPPFLRGGHAAKANQSLKSFYEAFPEYADKDQLIKLKSASAD